MSSVPGLFHFGARRDVGETVTHCVLFLSVFPWGLAHGGASTHGHFTELNPLGLGVHRHSLKSSMRMAMPDLFNVRC